MEKVSQRVHIVLTDKARDLIERIKEGSACTYEEQRIADQLYRISRRPDIALEDMQTAASPSRLGFYNWLQKDGFIKIESSSILDFLDSQFTPKKVKLYHLGDTCPEEYALTEKGRVLASMYPLITPPKDMPIPTEFLSHIPLKEITLGFYLTEYLRAQGQVLPWVIEALVNEGLLAKDDEGEELF